MKRMEQAGLREYFGTPVSPVEESEKASNLENTISKTNWGAFHTKTSQTANTKLTGVLGKVSWMLEAKKKKEAEEAKRIRQKEEAEQKRKAEERAREEEAQKKEAEENAARGRAREADRSDDASAEQALARTVFDREVEDEPLVTSAVDAEARRQLQEILNAFPAASGEGGRFTGAFLRNQNWLAAGAQGFLEAVIAAGLTAYNAPSNLGRNNPVDPTTIEVAQIFALRAASANIGTMINFGLWLETNWGRIVARYDDTAKKRKFSGDHGDAAKKKSRREGP